MCTYLYVNWGSIVLRLSFGLGYFHSRYQYPYTLIYQLTYTHICLAPCREGTAFSIVVGLISGDWLSRDQAIYLPCY